MCMHSYLWVFVSQFTDFDASRLHRLYKQALKKQRTQRPPSKVQLLSTCSFCHLFFHLHTYTWWCVSLHYLVKYLTPVFSCDWVWWCGQLNENSASSISPSDSVRRWCIVAVAFLQQKMTSGSVSKLPADNKLQSDDHHHHRHHHPHHQHHQHREQQTKYHSSVKSVEAKDESAGRHTQSARSQYVRSISICTYAITILQ